MSEEKTYTLSEAHQAFAAGLNGKTWELLAKADRTPDEDELMIHAAHGSMYHWIRCGTIVNQQRGHWLIARVYTVLGMTDPALHHARRCLDLTGAFPSEMKDFDFAYAAEGMARSLAMAGRPEEARTCLEQATAAGNRIADEEDRKWFFGDFESGPWSGLR